MPILFSCACKFKKQDEFSEATLLEACGYHATMQRKLADLALSAKRNEAEIQRLEIAYSFRCRSVDELVKLAERHFSKEQIYAAIDLARDATLHAPAKGSQ